MLRRVGYTSYSDIYLHILVYEKTYLYDQIWYTHICTVIWDPIIFMRGLSFIMFQHRMIPIQCILYHIAQSKIKTTQYTPSLRDTIVRMGHTSIYQYIHSIYTVHRHTSFGIRFDPHFAADESQLHACGFHPCELASCLQSPQLTGHPGAACHAKIATAGLTLKTFLPRLPSTAAASAQPNGKQDALRLLYRWGIVGVAFPARNNGMRGTLPRTDTVKGMVRTGWQSPSPP